MGQGLSEQSQEQWGAFALSVGSGVSRPLDRELLDQFLIGVHQRGEELSAHELKTLVEQLEVDPELARELVAFVEPAMGLLETYDRFRSPVDEGDDHDDHDHDDEVAYVGDDEVGPGILVM